MKDVVTFICNEILTDCENESEDLIRQYEEGNDDVKATIDAFCMYLCGWRFSTVMDMASEMEVEDD